MCPLVQALLMSKAVLLQAGTCADKGVTQVVTGLVHQLALHFLMPSEDARNHVETSAELTLQPAQLITFLVSVLVPAAGSCIKQACLNVPLSGQPQGMMWA